MASLLDIVDREACAADIAFVPLKGMALHALGLYEPGERPMADIDVLVQPQNLERMRQVISNLGYRTVARTADGCALVPVNQPRAKLTEHSENGITVELHARISRCMPTRVVDITPDLWSSTPHPGRNAYPNLVALMRHLLMHTAVNMQLRIVRMVQLHDMALLAPLLSGEDWQAMLDPQSPGGPRWWAFPPLSLLHRYYPSVVPAKARAAAALRCPPVLRIAASKVKLSGVSVSNPRRPIFPALFWSGSLMEASRCVTERLQQGARAFRGGASKASVNELQPWIERVHRRRSIDVLVGRARPETVMMLSAAINHDPAFATTHERPNVA
jgi:hypothetical protein